MEAEHQAGRTWGGLCGGGGPGDRAAAPAGSPDVSHPPAAVPLDAAALDDLRDELIFGQRLAVDEEGRVLVWTGPAAPEPDAQRGAAVESRFHALLPEVRTVLQRDRHITYRRLTSIFSLDKTLLEDVRRELLFQQVVRDEQGEGLVWTGEAAPVLPPTVAVPREPIIAETTTVPSPALPTRPLPITADELLSLLA